MVVLAVALQGPFPSFTAASRPAAGKNAMPLLTGEPSIFKADCALGACHARKLAQLVASQHREQICRGGKPAWRASASAVSLAGMSFLLRQGTGILSN